MARIQISASLLRPALALLAIAGLLTKVVERWERSAEQSLRASATDARTDNCISARRYRLREHACNTDHRRRLAALPGVFEQ
jgi:hypothetical protein